MKANLEVASTFFIAYGLKVQKGVTESMRQLKVIKSEASTAQLYQCN